MQIDRRVLENGWKVLRKYTNKEKRMKTDRLKVYGEDLGVLDIATKVA